VLEQSVHDAQCVVTARLQQDSSVIINVDITVSTNHTPPCPGIVPNVGIEVSQTDRGFVSFNQLCPTQMAYWAKNHVAILTRAPHVMTYQ